MFLIAPAKGVAIPSSGRKSSLGSVGISLATKNGFLSRALLGGQHLENKTIKKNKKKCRMSWTRVLFETLLNTFAARLCLSGSPPAPKRILSELTSKLYGYLEVLRSFERVLLSGRGNRKTADHPVHGGVLLQIPLLPCLLNGESLQSRFMKRSQLTRKLLLLFFRR